MGALLYQITVLGVCRRNARIEKGRKPHAKSQSLTEAVNESQLFRSEIVRKPHAPQHVKTRRAMIANLNGE